MGGGGWMAGLVENNLLSLAIIWHLQCPFVTYKIIPRVCVYGQRKIISDWFALFKVFDIFFIKIGIVLNLFC